jgi:hypothetical protein
MQTENADPLAGDATHVSPARKISRTPAVFTEATTATGERNHYARNTYMDRE